MNAFARAPMRPVVAAVAPASKTTSGSQQQRNGAAGGQKAAAATSTKSPSQRTVPAKRPRETDALFAEEEEDDEEDEEDAQEDEDEEEEQSATHRSRAAAGGGARSKATAAAPARRATDAAAAQDDESRPKKKSRTAPEELSSKKPVKSGVIVTALPSFNIEKKRRDPRFDPLCGDFDKHHFHSHYSWMGEAKSSEVDAWKAELRVGKRDKRPLTEEEREELLDNIHRAKQTMASSKRDIGESSLMREWKHSERLAQKDGKKPFFLKESEKKKLALAARFIDLKEKKGALQKFMDKQTKKVKNKDHKYMPREGREEH